MKEVDDLRSTMLGAQNELVSMMMMSMKSVVKDVNVLWAKMRKLHVSVGTTTYQLEVLLKFKKANDAERNSFEGDIIRLYSELRMQGGGSH